MLNPNTHNRLVVGSNPAEPTSELLQLRELLHIQLGTKGGGSWSCDRRQIKSG